MVDIVEKFEIRPSAQSTRGRSRSTVVGFSTPAVGPEQKDPDANVNVIVANRFDYGIISNAQIEVKTAEPEKLVQFGVLNQKDSAVNIARYHLGQYLKRVYIDYEIAKAVTPLASQKLKVFELCELLFEQLGHIEKSYAIRGEVDSADLESFRHMVSEAQTVGGIQTAADRVKYACFGVMASNVPTDMDCFLSYKEVQSFIKIQTLNILHMAQYMNKAIAYTASRLNTSGTLGWHIESAINAVKKFKTPIEPKDKQAMFDKSYANPVFDKRTTSAPEPESKSETEPEIKTTIVPCEHNSAYMTYEHLHSAPKFKLEALIKNAGLDSTAHYKRGVLNLGMVYTRSQGKKGYIDQRSGWKRLGTKALNAFLKLCWFGFDVAFSAVTNGDYFVPSREFIVHWRPQKGAGKPHNPTVDKGPTPPAKDTWEDLSNTVAKQNPSRSYGTQLGLFVRGVLNVFAIDPALAVLSMLGRGLNQILVDFYFYGAKPKSLKAGEILLTYSSPLLLAKKIESSARLNGSFAPQTKYLRSNLYTLNHNPIAAVLYNIVGYAMATIRLSLTLLSCLPVLVCLRSSVSAKQQLMSSIGEFGYLAAQSWKGISLGVNMLGSFLAGLILQRIPRAVGWLVGNQLLARCSPKEMLPFNAKRSMKLDIAAEKTASAFRYVTGLDAANEVVTAPTIV